MSMRKIVATVLARLAPCETPARPRRAVHRDPSPQKADKEMQ